MDTGFIFEVAQFCKKCFVSQKVFFQVCIIFCWKFTVLGKGVEFERTWRKPHKTYIAFGNFSTVFHKSKKSRGKLDKNIAH